MNMKQINTFALPAVARMGAEPVIYTCPMHPEVKENAPGKCPKCGMNLEPNS
jgi:hypothetical protein